MVIQEKLLGYVVTHVSLWTSGAFKPLSKRRASLSLHSSARTTSTDLSSKEAIRSSVKCSAGSHVFSVAE